VRGSVVKQLTLADEIVVLMLNDNDGEINESLAAVALVAVAGGILMELALRDRIDTDLDALFVVDPAPTGDRLLDTILREIGAEAERHPSVWWITQLPGRHDDLIAQTLWRLVDAGILREEQRHFLWMFARRAYPATTGGAEREAKARLMSVLFRDEVPEPRDALLLGLARAAGVLSTIMTQAELDKAAPRIAEVAALEEISRSVGLVSNEVWGAMASSSGPYPI
jgi:golgi phosphoprotein 3